MSNSKLKGLGRGSEASVAGHVVQYICGCRFPALEFSFSLGRAGGGMPIADTPSGGSIAAAGFTVDKRELKASYLHMEFVSKACGRDDI